MSLERLLKLKEELVELLDNERTRHRRCDLRDPKDDLQPLLDVELHVQRSEYCSDNVFVDNGVRATTYACSNLQHLVIRDRRLRKQ